VSLIFWVVGHSSLHHAMLDCYDSGVKQRTKISSEFTIHSMNVFFSNSNRCRRSADTTHYSFWLNINVFGTHQAHTFLKNKCSWIIVSTLPTRMPLLDAISCNVIHQFPKISLSSWNVFTWRMAIGSMWARSSFKTSLQSSEHLTVSITETCTWQDLFLILCT
jgi:hypothetical protein